MSQSASRAFFARCSGRQEKKSGNAQVKQGSKTQTNEDKVELVMQKAMKVPHATMHDSKGCAHCTDPDIGRLSSAANVAELQLSATE